MLTSLDFMAKPTTVWRRSLCPRLIQKQKLIEELDNKLSPRNTYSHVDMEVEWAPFRDAVHAAASEVMEPITRKHSNWFDDNDRRIQTLLEEKHQLHPTLFKIPTSTSKKEAFGAVRRVVQSELRRMQGEWLRTYSLKPAKSSVSEFLRRPKFCTYRAIH